MEQTTLAPDVRAELMTFIERLAAESGALIRKYYRSGYEVESKSDASPVTVADRAAEERMRELIMAAYPDHGILGEEYGHHQPEARYQWVLDPIDGTKNFISHGYLFGTLIAFTENGRPLLGAIHHPLVQDLLIGDGDQTWLNGAPVRVSACDRIEDAVMLTTDPFKPAQHHDGAAFERLARRVKRFRTWGDCHGYYLVAVGGADVMTDPIMNYWDRVALAPIIQGAGGRITDWRGGDPIHGDGVVATNGILHDEVIRWLNGGEGGN